MNLLNISEFDRKFKNIQKDSRDKFKKQLEFIKSKEAVPGERIALMHKANMEYTEDLVYNFLKDIFVDTTED